MINHHFNGQEITTKEELIEAVLSYNPNANVPLISKAYDFAAKAHAGQLRESGEPYFIHPFEVAKILVKLKGSSTTIASALLHDVAEDTRFTLKDISVEFGDEISEIVSGVTKMRSINFANREDYSAENIRKIVLATAKDVRVILIKLADKLHNMRTLKFMPPDKQKIAAKEVVEIYAPIAYKLGMHRVKAELEDLALKYINPEVYAELKSKISTKKDEREEEIHRIIEKIKENLKKKGLVATVYGRTKHFYSIYRKMMVRNKKFEEIYDLYAIRIICDNAEDCYAILGIIHSIYHPLPDRLKDYIAIPKHNMYQSLHTQIVVDGKPVEVQIRTRDMHVSAEDGIAAHWRFKGTERDKKFDQKITWLKQILSWKSEESGKQFIDSLKIDLFGNEIVVFTPKGDPINLPEGSTPVDFAYNVHTEIGSKCNKAKVNGDIVPLDHILKSGDIVEILTSKNAQPSRHWLNFVKSPIAKGHIRGALNIKGIQLDSDDYDEKSAGKAEIEVLDAIKISKNHIKLAGCCAPLLSDEIVGLLTKDKKLTIHKKSCDNLKLLQDAKNDMRPIKVAWKQKCEGNIKRIKLILSDRVGLLAEILNIIAESGMNVTSINTDLIKDKICINLSLNYPGPEQFETAMQAIRAIKNVIAVHYIDKYEKI